MDCGRPRAVDIAMRAVGVQRLLLEEYTTFSQARSTCATSQSRQTACITPQSWLFCHDRLCQGIDGGWQAHWLDDQCLLAGNSRCCAWCALQRKQGRSRLDDLLARRTFVSTPSLPARPTRRSRATATPKQSWLMARTIPLGGRMLLRDQIARTAVFLASEDSSAITSQVVLLTVDRICREGR